MSIRELKSAIGALREKYGSVKAAKKVGITPVSLQAFLQGSEVYAKTLGKLQKAAGMEVTAVPAHEKVKLAAKAKKAAKLEKKAARAAKKSVKKSAKPKKRVKAKVKTKAKAKRYVIGAQPKMRSKKTRDNIKAAAKEAKTKSKKKRPAKVKKKAAPSKHTNGIAGHAKAVAAEEAEEALEAALDAAAGEP